MRDFMFRFTVACLVTSWAVATFAQGPQRPQPIPRVAAPAKQQPNTDAMIWRFIGPMMGNRGSAVIGHPINKNVFYFGASGGLRKTIDAGLTWMPLGDGQFQSSSVGAVAIAPSNPDIMYVGTGEPQMRNNVSWGDGVYRSDDGGETWTHLGLEESHHISQVRIHPTNPDIVYVGVYGHAFGPNPERGVYRTTDGGKSWKRVLFKSDQAGVIDLVMNPANPQELYAAIWEFERKAWGPKTGGPDSGLWKTTDGGETWTEFTYAEGLPEGGRGREGLTMSAADPNRLYALIDSETKPGLYRSDDRAQTWSLVSDFFQIIGRPFYYTHIYANPSNADQLWSPNNRIFSSQDAGKNWTVEPGIKDDFHDVWIDANDANRMIATCDGGVQVTLNGGLSWSQQYTQKISQIYRVHTDDQFPYNVYGNSQDILAYKVPSASRWGGISGYETTIVGNGETGDVIPNPNDPNIVYSMASGTPLGGGSPFTKNNLTTGQSEVRNISPEPIFGQNASDLKFRFQWDSPFIISQHDPNTIYACAQVVFRTRDEGMNWEQISPDLTRNHPDKQVITGTPWLPEYFGQEIYSTITRLAESPLQKGVLWAGSDDGMIHVTMDGGQRWQDRSIPELPDYAYVRSLEASPHDAGTLYVAISRYNTADDYAPYVFKTTDFGKTWTSINGNLPKDLPTYTLREDPQVKGLLYLATDRGVMASVDDGTTWKSIRKKMPVVPITDLRVKDNDLVVATNGRGFWVLDDLTPLREYCQQVADQPAYLYSVQDHTRFGFSWWMSYAPGGDPGGMKKYFIQNMRPSHIYYELGVVNGEKKRKFVDAGDAKPLGVMMYFRLIEGVKDVSITILDESGDQIITYGQNQLRLRYAAPGDDAHDAGLNRFVWDMRYPAPPTVPNRPPTPILPIAKPGTYMARLTVDGVSQERQFELRINPNEPYTREQTDARMVFWLDLHQTVIKNTNNVIAALELSEASAAQVNALQGKGVDATVLAEAEKQSQIIAEAAATYESAFVPTGRTLAETINLPAKAFSKLTWLHQMMEMTEGPVTGGMKAKYAAIQQELQAATEAYQNAVKPAAAKLNALSQ